MSPPDEKVQDLGGSVRTAMLSDIHGNLHALQAVLADIAQQEVDRIYCMGDLVGYGAYRNEVRS